MEAVLLFLLLITLGRASRRVLLQKILFRRDASSCLVFINQMS